MSQSFNRIEENITDVVLDEALQWAVVMRSGSVKETDQQRLKVWLNEQPEHLQAWQQIQAIEQDFATIKQAKAGSVLYKSDKSSLLLGSAFSVCILCITYYTGALNSHYWRADYATRAGEHKTIMLDSGAELILDSDTAIAINREKDRPEIELLKGRVYVDSAHAPLLLKPSVSTAQGSFIPTGTKFTVNYRINETRLQVLEGMVTLKSNKIVAQVAANQGWILSKNKASPISNSTIKPGGWTKFIIEADNAKLADVLDTLSQYHSGFLVYSQAVGNLKVSGTFQLNNVNNALLAIKASLPVDVNHTTKWYTKINLENK